MELSVAIPTYNEEKRLKETVKEARDVLDDTCDFEIIIVDGGSDDSTVSISRDLADKDDRIRLIELENGKKGESIEEAFRKSEGELFAFVDADGSTPPHNLKDMVETLSDSDIVIGSRYLSEDTDRSTGRGIASKSFNTIMQALFDSKVKDHQCGFKGFRRKEVEGLFEDINSRHWFWDAEMLVRAQKRDIQIEEIPVDWEEKGGSGINLIQDSLFLTGKIAWLRGRLTVEDLG